MEKKGWKIVETGSAAGLDGSIAKAAERGENWFGYYWSPTALIGKYNMQAVDMGEFAGKDGMKYLKKRVYPGPVMNGMLVWMGENQAEGADAAVEFLKTQEDVWSKWVSGKAKKAIKASL